MDRHLGPHFQIPAGGVFVFTLIWASISLVLLDRCTLPAWQKLGAWLVVDTSSTNWNGLLLQHGRHCFLCHHRTQEARAGPHPQSNESSPCNRSHVGFMAPYTTHTTRNRVCILFARRSRVLPPRVPQISKEYCNCHEFTWSCCWVLLSLSTAIVGLVKDNSSWLPHDI